MLGGSRKYPHPPHDRLLEISDQFRFPGNLPTYPSHKLTLTLNSHLGQNDGLGEGKMGSFPGKYVAKLEFSWGLGEGSN